jgi:16S rRNA (cytidine1402-2'-O)-methyltransferase
MHKSSKENFNYLNKTKPGLYLVSTPIGNLEDITLRAIKVLKYSDIILCEDTRNSMKLLNRYNIKKKLISYHKFNEKKKLKEITDLINKNKIISLISDAGTPTISDPGKILVNECIKLGISIYPLPGPSALILALSASGFSDKSLFYGFLPNKKNQIENELKKLSNFEYSIVFFISSKKFLKVFDLIKIFFSDRKIFIAKEMTKLYEKYIQEDVSKLNIKEGELKGELTVVISNASADKKDFQNLRESVKKEIKEMLKIYTIKDIVSFISKKETISKKIIYDYCLKLKK